MLQDKSEQLRRCAQSLILSNSSMQQIPRSDRTTAPDSRTNSLVSGSLWTEAVRPTAEEPFPDVYTPLGAILCTYDSSCGTPASQRLALLA